MLDASNLLRQPLANAPAAALRARWPFDASTCWALVFGLALSWSVARHLFAPGYGEFVDNHDHQSYGQRVVEFREGLRSGYLFPQWCPHFRGGLGSPYFAYYQPLFFYVGSLTPADWPLARQVAAPTYLFLTLGYAGMFLLVRHRFGPLAGMLAATLFLTAPYVHTELFPRGDFSELAAMMLVPWFLHGLLAFVERPSPASGWLGALSGAALVTAHPAVALATFGLLAALVLGEGLRRRDRAFLTRSMLVGAAAIGLASFYWLGVFADANRVSVDEAWRGRIFDGYYHFSKHFVPLAWMVGPRVTPTPIPVKLGVIHGLVALGGLIAAGLRWRRWNVTQRQCWTFGAGLCVAALFLITPWSEFVWRTLPLLERIQFPWRLFSLAYVGVAILGGVAVASLRQAAARSLAATVVGLAAVAFSWMRPAPAIEQFTEPTSAADLANVYLAPDLANEWLSRGAKPLHVAPRLRVPRCGPGAAASNYTFGHVGLACRVTTREPSHVVLPHYYFSDGWRATLDEQPLALHPTASGLMRVDLPANASGILAVRWHTTRSKWIGLALTTASLVTFAGLLFWHQRQQLPPSAPLPSPPRHPRAAPADAP